jgi:hypothetical protein
MSEIRTSVQCELAGANGFRALRGPRAFGTAAAIRPRRRHNATTREAPMNELNFATPETGTDRKWKAVYTIVETPGRNGNPDRKLWLRLGMAFVNRDGSLNVKLDAVPTNGTLHIRDQAPDELRGRRDESAQLAQKAMV